MYKFHIYYNLFTQKAKLQKTKRITAGLIHDWDIKV